MGRKNRHIYNVNILENKIEMSEREHVALNNYFWDKQSPREQFQKVFELTKWVLSEWVRRELYTILYEADDDMFYIPELLKWKKKKKNGTNTEKQQKNADTD